MGIMSIRKVARRLLAPVIIVLVVAMTIGLFYIGLPSAGKGDNLYYKGPAAKVNGEKIKDADFNQLILNLAQQAAQYGMSYTQSQLRDIALTRSVRDIALAQEMKKVQGKIRVSGKDIDNFIKKYFKTQEELQSYLERSGYTEKDFRKLLQKDLEQQKFLALKAREFKIKVPKADVLKEIEQIQVSHILISSDKSVRTEDAALKLANDVYQKAVSGSDFAKLAKDYSDDPGSKEKGGQYGPMSVGEFQKTMAQEFVNASLALTKGAISKPVKTQWGYHIIKLDNRFTPTGSEYKEKYTAAESALLVEQVNNNPKFTDWMNKIYRKADANTEILDPGLRAYRLKQEGKFQEAAAAYEKALKRSYYNTKWDFYLEASEAYIRAKEPQKAIKLLKGIPKESMDEVEVQLGIALAYKEDNQQAKAIQMLTKFGAAHPDDSQVHERLKEMFTQWKMTDLVAKEEATLAAIAQKEKAEQERIQQNYQQKDQGANTLQPSQPSTNNQQPTTNK